MAIVDIKGNGIGLTLRKKLKRDMTIYPLLPYKGGGWAMQLLPGIYQMRPRPYKGKNSKSGSSEHNICVRMKFYKPSNQSQPKKVARQNIFRDGKNIWKALSQSEKEVYNNKAIGTHKYGYNIFMCEYLKSH